MKSIWNSFKIAFSMFSKIPMPRADWSKENMKYMLCFFPFVGIVIGVAEILWAYICSFMNFTILFSAMGMVIIPVIVTGGIHIDGLLDTADALSSWRERERRLEILKDSHCGAFAVITCCVYFLVWYAAACQINMDMDSVCVLALGFVLSRCLSALGVISLPKANAKGTVAEFSKNTENPMSVKVFLAVLMLLILGAMAYIRPVAGTLTFASALVVFIYYCQMAYRTFGGTTGDLSGYFLSICEVTMTLALAITTRGGL